MKKIIIALDGHSGCGKSSTAKAVARELAYAYIDTGAMYRSVALYLLDNQIDINDVPAVSAALEHIKISFRFAPETKTNETFLNGKNVEVAIREMRISEQVSAVAKISEVRRFLVAEQREVGKSKAVVIDGRDIASVVFPEAELKIFMTADLRTRARRRLAEMGSGDLEAVVENLRQRDEIDSNRADSPLRQTEDAVLVDTTEMKFEDQVSRVTELAREVIDNQ